MCSGIEDVALAHAAQESRAAQREEQSYVMLGSSSVNDSILINGKRLAYISARQRF